MSNRKRPQQRSKVTPRPNPPTHFVKSPEISAAKILGNRTIVASVVSVVVAAIIGIVVQVLTSPTTAKVSATNSQSPRPSQVGGIDFERALKELESSDPRAVDDAVNYIGVTYYNATGDLALRRKIIHILVQYVSYAAPAMPSAGDSFGYCLRNPPPNFPSGLSEALRIIGSRNPNDIGQNINLSDVNLAYLTLDDLNFQNVNFDNDLLCRVISYNSNFRGATFDGADLRFIIIQYSKGLTAGQLQNVYSLFKAKLPKILATNKLIEVLIRKDPALINGFS